MTRPSGKRSGGSMACISFCVLALLTFAGLFVYPPARKAARLETEAKKTRTMIDTQNKLIPLYTQLLTTTRYQPAEDLKIPKKKSLSTDEIVGVSAMLDAMAVKCGLRLTSSVPRPDFSADAGRVLQVDLTLHGPFDKFRDFLLMLGAMPELSHMQRIMIGKDGPYEKMEIMLWLAIES